MPTANCPQTTRPSQPPKQQTAVRRNRCRLDDVAKNNAISVDNAKKFAPDLVMEIIRDHWTLPLRVPSSFPLDYPPTAPLLDTPLAEPVARDLRRAFTQNNVTYAISGVKGNLMFELFGDKYMASLLSQSIQEDLSVKGEGSIYSGLDLGGMDIIFRQICCGVQQSFFAMMYNFPARITVAYKQSPFHHRQIFSQRDLEGTFEAYLAVCQKHVDREHLQQWFDALIAPWIPGTIEEATQFQRARDGAEGIQDALASTNKGRHALLERRPATERFVGKLPYVMDPTLQVQTVSQDEKCQQGHPAITQLERVGNSASNCGFRYGFAPANTRKRNCDGRDERSWEDKRMKHYPTD